MRKKVTAVMAEKNFSDLLKFAGKEGNSVVITQKEQQPVIMMSLDEFEGWVETVNILSDPELAKDLRLAIEEMKAGKRPMDTVDFETLRKELKL